MVIVLSRDTLSYAYTQDTQQAGYEVNQTQRQCGNNAPNDRLHCEVCLVLAGWLARMYIYSLLKIMKTAVSRVWISRRY